MSTSKTKPAIVYGLLLLVIVIWGFNFSFVKWVISRIHPLAFNVTRFSLASLLILTLLWVKEGWQPMPVTDILKMAALGVLGHSIYQIFFIKGLSLTTAGNSSLLIATSPIWTALISAGLKKDEVTKKAWLGIVLAFVGVFLVTLGGGGKISFASSKTTGDLLTLTAALALSLYTVLSRDLLERYSPLRLTAVTMFFGVVGLWIFAGRRVVAQDWSSMNVTSLGVIVYSAVFAVVVGYVVWFTAVRTVGPTRVAVFNNMTPIVAFSVALVLLGEPVGWLQVLGGLTVITGVVTTVRN
jgi:drug/metabolite transporter (DMT)-like permease